MASVVVRALTLLRAPANSLGFALRQWRRPRRQAAELVDEDKQRWLRDLDDGARAAAAARERQLAQRHDLAALRARSSRLHWAENLALLDLLERTAIRVPAPVAGPLRAVDVGSGAFQYATALQRFLARAATAEPGPVELTGVELDGNGVYRDGSSRAQHARAHAALAGAAFAAGDFARLSLPPQHVVTMLFPFLSAYPLLRWGLPLRALQPRRLLERAAGLLVPGGVLLVVNQTGAEFEQLRELLDGLPLRLEREGSWRTDLVPYAAQTEDRVGSWWRRD